MNLESYFVQLEAGLRHKLAEKETARRRFVYEIGRIGSRLFDKNFATAWTTIFVPFEILNSMGVASIFVEFVGGVLSGAGMAGQYLQRAEAAGYSTDSCSYHRAIIGAALEGMLPEPDVLIGATYPCDGGVKALSRIGEICHKELFVLNIPHETGSVDYLVDQYRKMIAHLEEKTGRSLDYERLRESIRLDNEARGYLLEALQLCKNSPAPSNSNDWKNFIIYALLSGTAEGVKVARAYRDEFREQVAHNTGALPQEKYRLLWIQNRVQFPTRFLEILEQKFGANVVIDEFSHVYWDEMDETDPLRSLALRQITHPLVGPVANRLRTLVELAREYRVHGAVNPAHWGCRQSGGARFMIQQALSKVKVPVIHLDVDCVDERNFAEGQVMTRLEAFMEML